MTSCFFLYHVCRVRRSILASRINYRPQRSCESYVFIPVCLSTGGCLPQCMLGYCNSMPLVRLGLTMCVVKCLYFLVWHCVSKITLLFCLGGSCQSLKVREVKCVPRDPATTCPVLFKGSRSLLLLA